MSANPNTRTEIDDRDELELYRELALKFIREEIRTAKVQRIRFRSPNSNNRNYMPCSPKERRESREFLTTPSRTLGIYLDALNIDMDLFIQWTRRCAADGWPIYGGEDLYDSIERSDNHRLALIEKGQNG